MKGSNNKNKYILFGALGVLIIIGLVTLGVSFAYTDNTDLLKNQQVDGLSFENAKIEYKDKVSTFSVIVYNENNAVYDANKINIVFTDNKGKDLVLTSDIEIPLEADEGRLITVTVDKDITNMKELKYILKK